MTYQSTEGLYTGPWDMAIKMICYGYEHREIVLKDKDISCVNVTNTKTSPVLLLLT